MAVPAKNLTAALADFTSKITFESLPKHTVERTEDLFADWFFCAVAGADYRPLVAYEKFARDQGGEGNGKNAIADIFTSKKGLTPYWAAFLNAGAGHVVEQDDVHKWVLFFLKTCLYIIQIESKYILFISYKSSSVTHPATVSYLLYKRTK